MTKKLLTLLVLISAVISFIGIRDDMVRKADADEETAYTVHVAENTEYGYVLKYDFTMSKPSLEAHIKLCWWKATWLDNGDLLLAFDDDGNTWFVKLMGNDPEIREIQRIVEEYGLKCTIPDK